MNQEYTQAIHDLLIENEDTEDAVKMKKYMRNQFAFLGIRAPERKVLVKSLLEKHGNPPEEHFQEIMYELWKLPEREYQSIALDLMDRRIKRFKEEDIELLEHLIVNKSWWDTVDWIASKHAGHYFLQYPKNIKSITGRWIASKNIWLQRAAILFQLKYKKQTDEDLLYNYINRCLGSEEFFINKAIGWALREYSKTNPESVLEFVHQTPLARLSEMEAMKVMKKNK
ncbi:DNA alkylation repair protein [Oceanobacillus sp. CFH 90083]|uniref:DNA alkylation repair protein n=1 Tax=Oceanobacillus sp. CFH 90083 TaxID=2592336 RepID=UPI00128C41EC|nr:DNA alkylation repair protein [Oceanobacillus sp. CFH 90083]